MLYKFLIIILTILLLFPSLELLSKENIPPLKIAIFMAEGFPTIDTEPIPPSLFSEALKDFNLKIISSLEDLKNSLSVNNFDIFILPYGSAFPVQGWSAIKNFLNDGGNFINIGGAPFHQPVLWKVSGEKGVWILGTRQPTWAKELLIGPSESFDLDKNEKYSIVNVGETGWKERRMPLPTKVFELVVRFATSKDFEKEDGSSGQREALLRPLVHILDSSGIPRFSPLIEIDRLAGNYRGGRWIFLTSNMKLDSSILRSIVKRAIEGPSEIKVFPIPACIEPGEGVKIRIVLRRPKPREGERIVEKARLLIKKEDGKKVLSKEIPLYGEKENRIGEFLFETKRGSEQGFYRIEVLIPDADFNPKIGYSGFWIKDKDLLENSPKISVSRDWLWKDGKVFPIVGTTYMGSDVHRKFLFEPNPFIWEKDFEMMEKAGINFVRTGIWTGWSRAMLDPWAIDENFLRALEAFVLTSARHKIVVCFTFFAFLPPPSWSPNPYLDPSAIEWQKSFISNILNRFKNCGWIHFDLINEPSYAPKDFLWQNRPFYDEFERKAWIDWVYRKHGKDPVNLSILWKDSLSPLSLPQSNEFSYSPSIENRKYRKVMDFHLFSQEIFSEWAKKMSSTIKKISGGTLVTVGQDEAGTSFSPSPQFHYDSVDYTCIHTWWNNSDLLWDGVMTKIPEKPNLVQETGIMRLEDIDGNLWRSSEESWKLLERKFAYAFASRSAGAVQWIWNINPYQPIDNEAVIGIFRVDGTAKPELDVLMNFSKFFNFIAPHLEDYESSEIFLVIPHSRIFSRRPFPLDSTKRIVRVLSDYFGIVPIAISEFKITFERIKNAKLLILPSPEFISESALSPILEASKNGVKVLITGPLTGDCYGRIPELLLKSGLFDPGNPLCIREKTQWSLKSNPLNFVTFERGEIEWLKKGSKPINFEGNIWNEPLPLEFAREEEPLIALLKEALKNSGVPFYFSEIPITTSILKTKDHIFAIFINESSSDLKRSIEIDSRRYDFSVPAFRASIFCIERKTGKIVASYLRITDNHE